MAYAEKQKGRLQYEKDYWDFHENQNESIERENVDNIYRKQIENEGEGRKLIIGKP